MKKRTVYILIILSFLIMFINSIFFSKYTGYVFQSSSQASIGLIVEGIYCGNGRCDGNESCSTCTEDCGICPVVPPTTVVSEGGGGIRTRTISLKIGIPSPFNLEETGTIKIPITLENNGQTEFKQVTLTSYVLKDSVLSSIKAEFDRSYFESIKTGTKEEVFLTVEISTDEIAIYEVVINASSKSPLYSDDGYVYLNFIGKNVSGIKKMVVFTENMIAENPECLELKEMVEEANRAFEEGRFQEAIEKSNKAVEACREAISGPKQPVFPTLKGQEYILVYLGLGILLAIILGLIFFIYRKIRFRKKYPRRKPFIFYKRRKEEKNQN